MSVKIAEVISFLESLAPLSLQENYDNAGLITGHPSWQCRGIVCCLDATEEVIREAIGNNCNLVVAHHPIIFGGLKKINGSNYVEQSIIAAIKNDIAVYAIHTNLDNVLAGVSGVMAGRLGLTNVSILAQRPATLKKLFTFVPEEKVAQVRDAIFKAGAGQIGNYSECSFNTDGKGTFKAGDGAHPYVGSMGERHVENEVKVEVVMPAHIQGAVLRAMLMAHPYEEVAYDVVDLANMNPMTGSGVIGELAEEEDERVFLERLKRTFDLELVRHSPLSGRGIRKVALCGGTGSSLITSALNAGADAFVTADLKYHEFFDANGRILLADIGHYESEQYTIGFLQENLEQKFPTFAVLKTAVKTNPVRYFR